MSGSSEDGQSNARPERSQPQQPGHNNSPAQDSTPPSGSPSNLEAEYREMEQVLGELPPLVERGDRFRHPGGSRKSPDPNAPSPLVLVETAFLASTASLLWLASYYLSLVPWMRIIFPLPLALVYLRWGQRAAWMSTLVSGLLLSVLMGPYLSVLFLVPYGLIGVQVGALWRRGAPWSVSIGIGTLLSTLGFFFRVWLLSTFLGEDLWIYLTGRITDLLEWGMTRLVDWGILNIGILGQVNITVVQIFAVLMVMLSDVIYLFTIHLAGWLLLERVGNPIPDPPRWVQVLMEE